MQGAGLCLPDSLLLLPEIPPEHGVREVQPLQEGPRPGGDQGGGGVGHVQVQHSQGRGVAAAVTAAVIATDVTAAVTATDVTAVVSATAESDCVEDVSGSDCWPEQPPGAGG